jgi:hypothetical protein
LDTAPLSFELHEIGNQPGACLNREAFISRKLVKKVGTNAGRLANGASQPRMAVEIDPSASGLHPLLGHPISEVPAICSEPHFRLGGV